MVLLRMVELGSRAKAAARWPGVKIALSDGESCALERL